MSNRLHPDMLQVGKDRTREREFLPRSAKKATPVRRKSSRGMRSNSPARDDAYLHSQLTSTPARNESVMIEVQTNIQIFRLHRIDSSTEEFTIGKTENLMFSIV
jgi:hypothetical protein